MLGAFPSRPALDPTHVEVIELELDGPADRDVEALLTPEERARGQKLLLERDRVRFTRARAGLRIVLGACLGVGAASVRIRQGRGGKPELELGHAPLRFNLSHSGGRALVAVALGRDLGVDLELVRDDLDHLAMARRFFTPREKAAILASEHGSLAAFYRCWVAKESYLKARGEGLASPLDAFEVDPDAPTGGLRWSALEDDPRRWRIEQLNVGHGCAAALTCEEGDWRVRRWRGPPDIETDERW
jgi:4'-phosphopantetheinyl transferase